MTPGGGFLKRLRLHGFKSFAGATELEFGPGITAIVGPNGSGKSNIADALRWVLGEQNPRLLRLRRLEDLVFGGTAERAAQGMAEVTVVFDNSAGRFPLPHAEVALTRRAYRSGEGEVLVNRSPARLRDLQDLLLSAGIGHHSYLFVPQGMAEAFLTWRPEERRALIEDAAGVRHLRVQLAEAQERHRAAVDNMERIDLILAELAPQVRHGERLAKRAQERGELERRLGEALGGWYGRLWHDGQVVLSAAVERAAGAREEEERLQSALQAGESDLEASQAALGDLERRYRTLERMVSEHREAARLARAAGEREMERSQALAREQSLWREQIEAVRSERRAQEAELAETTARRASTAERLRSPGQVDRAGAAAGDEVADSLGRLAREVEERQAAYDESARQIMRLQVETEQTTAQRRRLEDELVERASDRQRLALPLLRAHRGRQAAERRRQSAVAVAVDAYATRDRLATRLTEARTKLAVAEQAARAARQDVASAQARRAALEASHVGVADAEERGQIAVALGLEADTLLSLMDAIVVPEGLETAVAAALDSALHALLVPRRRGLVQTAAALTEQAAARTLLPLDARTAQRPPVPSAVGVLGLAADLVECAAEHRAAVEALLGGVLVVEGWQAANGWLETYPAVVVTRDGQRRYPTGAVTVGAGAATGAPLRDRRVAQELEAWLRKTEARQETAVRDQEGAEASLMRSQRALADAERGMANAQRAVRAQDAEETDARRRELSLAEQAAALRARKRDAQRRQAALAATEAALLPRLSETRHRREQLRLSLEAVRGEWVTLQEAEVGRQAAEAERELERRLAEEAVAAAERALVSLRHTVARLDQQQEGLLLRLANAHASEGECRANAERLFGEASDAQARAEASAADEADLTRRLRDRAERLAGQQSERLALQKALPDAARQRATADGEVVRYEHEVRRVESDALADGLSLPLPAPAGDDVEASRRQVERLRQQWRTVAAVDAEELAAYEAIRSRWEELTAQREDLRETEVQWREAAALLERMLKEQFSQSFEAVNAAFGRQFQRLFGGGRATLVLSEGEEGAGIDLMLQPPGKRAHSPTALSGGERALAAAALLLALLSVRPTPFVLLDEVDAALDQANLGRFLEALREMAQDTQIILITHQPASIEAAGHWYGVVRQDRGVAQTLSLRANGAANANESAKQMGSVDGWMREVRAG